MTYLTNKAYAPVLFAMDLLGKALFMFKKRRSVPEKMRKALFIRLEHIGDIIMASPAFESWKRSHPGCEVHVLCRKLTAPLLENNPFVDKTITYEAPWFTRRGKGSKSLFSLLGELRKEKYDIVFEMHGDSRNNYIAWKTGAYSVGYGCRGGGFFLDEVVPYSGKLQMVRQNLLLVKKYCPSATQKTKLYSDNVAVKECGTLMKRYGLRRNRFIILHPGSGRNEKDLTDAEVEEFIKRGLKSGKYKIVLTGSNEELGRNRELAKRNNLIELTGKTSLLCLVELVRNAKKVIAPDTSVIHIARAVGTAYKAVYKTTDEKIWGYPDRLSQERTS